MDSNIILNYCINVNNIYAYPSPVTKTLDVEMIFSYNGTD